MKHISQTRNRSESRARNRTCLRVEALEDRLVLATVTIGPPADNGHGGSDITITVVPTDGEKISDFHLWSTKGYKFPDGTTVGDVSLGDKWSIPPNPQPANANDTAMTEGGESISVFTTDTQIPSSGGEFKITVPGTPDQVKEKLKDAKGNPLYTKWLSTNVGKPAVNTQYASGPNGLGVTTGLPYQTRAKLGVPTGTQVIVGSLPSGQPSATENSIDYRLVPIPMPGGSSGRANDSVTGYVYAGKGDTWFIDESGNGKKEPNEKSWKDVKDGEPGDQVKDKETKKFEKYECQADKICTKVTVEFDANGVIDVYPGAPKKSTEVVTGSPGGSGGEGAPSSGEGGALSNGLPSVANVGGGELTTGTVASDAGNGGGGAIVDRLTNRFSLNENGLDSAFDIPDERDWWTVL